MPDARRNWINYLAGAVGGVLLAVAIVGLSQQITLWHTFLAVLGFLIAGWAALDLRRYRRGTPESEVDGGRTIE
jgi:hypothetical protein